ncbi:MAG: 30S ribosomal protein S19 [Candidatus Woesearchaeota archaeon]|nr:30S ribosomal protein S19 [Candidatus Woesearchaeota archaeon]
MAKKEFTYRGKKLEELQKMSIKEFAELLPARQRRSLSRGFTKQQKIFLDKIEHEEKIETHCRNMIVLPNMVGKMIKIHNGKDFVMVQIKPGMIGHYFGEFAQTRAKVSHHAPGIGATKSTSHVGVK